MKQKPKSSNLLENEEGLVIVACLMVMLLVTILGVMAIRTSMSDLKVTTNNQIYKKSFYAAEAARAYVRSNSLLYGSDNITLGSPLSFPDAAAPSLTENVISGENEAFNGTVEYLQSSVPPRGSGYQVGKFRSHIYAMTCRGHGPREAVTTIEAGFYRIGF
jgi:hypothetical protein